MDALAKEPGYYRKLIKDNIVRFKDKVVRAPICIDIIEGLKYVRLATYGGISVIMGAQKSKKTHLLLIMIAACLRGIIFNFCGRNESKKVVLFDTEQNLPDIEIGLWKIVELTGGDKHPENLEVISLNALDADDQLCCIEQYMKDSQDVGFVAVDGLLDLVNDFNDIRESKDCYIRIKKLIKDYKIHFCGIIHTGTANENQALGHIGRVFQRKAESVIEIKEKNDVLSMVSARFIRGTRKFKPFFIGIDDRGMPYIDTDFEETDKTPF